MASSWQSASTDKGLIDMSAEENKAVFLRYFEDAWGGRHPENLEWLGKIRAAFPDLKVTPDKVLAAEGGHVVIMFTGTGTHKGDYRGVPATGEPITFRGTTVARIENGKNVDEFAATEKMGAVMFGLTSWLEQVGWRPQD